MKLQTARVYSPLICPKIPHQGFSSSLLSPHSLPHSLTPHPHSLTPSLPHSLTPSPSSAFLAHPIKISFLRNYMITTKGHISSGTPTWRIAVHAVIPFLIPFSDTYVHMDNVPYHFYHFYNLPIVKVITSTLCCILIWRLQMEGRKEGARERIFIWCTKDLLFLVFLTINVLQCAPGKYNIEWYEVLLWIWIFACLSDEVMQYCKDRG
jgi:hypothetical protein